MPLIAGTRLGAYEIVGALGAGGMGEVYRARDTKLGRSVAIKVLPDAVLSDPDRIARFEREAKLLAALNHHNIAALHGMEEAGGRHFLIMELVEGETLAERLAARRDHLDLDYSLMKRWPSHVRLPKRSKRHHEQVERLSVGLPGPR